MGIINSASRSTCANLTLMLKLIITDTRSISEHLCSKENNIFFIVLFSSYHVPIVLMKLIRYIFLDNRTGYLQNRPVTYFIGGFADYQGLSKNIFKFQEVFIELENKKNIYVRIS